MKNLYTNARQFSKRFQKAVVKLVDYEIEMNKYDGVTFSYYKLSKNMKHISCCTINKCYSAAYNVQLCEFLKNKVLSKLSPKLQKSASHESFGEEIDEHESHEL